MGNADDAGKSAESADEASEVVDGLTTFLNQIARFPLLTPAEEVVLAKAVACGDSAARRRMIESNLRLVVSVARPYAHLGVPLLDLVQEGTIGLDTAVRRFDWRRGCRFSTYATWWIRQAVVRALTNEGRMIRLPNHVHDRLRAISRARRSLETTLGREPTSGELARRAGLRVEEVDDALRTLAPTLSLDQPAGIDGDSELGRLIPDGAAVDPAEQMIAALRRESLRKAVSHLPPREREVIERRFREWTVDEIAGDLGIARGSVRRLVKQGVAHLAVLGVD